MAVDRAALKMNSYTVDGVLARGFMRGDDGSLQELPRDQVLAARYQALSCRDTGSSRRVVVWCTGQNLSVFSILRRVYHEWRRSPWRLPHWFAKADDLVVDAASGKITLRVRGYLSDDLDRLEFQCVAPIQADALEQIKRLWSGRDFQ